MNTDDYGEIINGKMTYNIIAEELKKGDTVGVGWSDEYCTHLDLIFKLGITKHGYFQRGIRQDNLFVSIIDHTCYAFKADSIKVGGYIQEKLRMEDTCGDKLAELINGIIKELNND